MIQRRMAVAGIATKAGNHSFRATGITAYLKNGGSLEKADRRRDEMTLDEVEKLGFEDNRICYRNENHKNAERSVSILKMAA